MAEQQSSIASHRTGTLFVNTAVPPEAVPASIYRARVKALAQSIANNNLAKGVESPKILHIPIDGGLYMKAKIFRPPEGKEGPLPGLVFIPGTGFITNLDSHDGYCSELAKSSGRVVIAIEPPLAPNYLHAAIVEHAYAATHYIFQHAAEFGIDQNAFSIGGHSSGANLAGLISVKAAQEQRLKAMGKLPEILPPKIKDLLLVTPRADLTFRTAESLEYQDSQKQDPYFNQANSKAAVDAYWPKEKDRASPEGSLINADLSNQPPALIVTGTNDGTRADAEKLAQKYPHARVVRFYRGFHNEFFVDKAQPQVIGQELRAMNNVAAREQSKPSLPRARL